MALSVQHRILKNLCYSKPSQRSLISFFTSNPRSELDDSHPGFRICMASTVKYGHLGCQSFPSASYHTTTLLNIAKASNTKRKIIKKIKFSKTKPNKDLPLIEIYEGISVKALADVMGKDIDAVFEAMLYIPNTDSYDQTHAKIHDSGVLRSIATLNGFRVKFRSKKVIDAKEDKDEYNRPPPEPCALVKRPPVVTIMGHVDHGKTTLLDSLRHSHVVDQEFGGITQHIGAFSVSLSTGEKITFLDTPGHAAFSAMRSRGAHITDIVVLVVAAEDGVMNQTVESIKHAQHSGVPVIVAINKIDRPEANIEGTKQGLLDNGIQLEEFGGDVQAVPISALKGTNLDKLQESILALAELLELKADPTGLVEGSVIEAKTDPGRGKLCTMLIQRGTLKKGAVLVAGDAWAKVKGLFDQNGKPVADTSPGYAVEIIGWKELPSAGDIVLEVESERRANEIIQFRKDKQKSKLQDEMDKVSKQKLEAHRKVYSEKRQKFLDMGRGRPAIYRKERTKEAEEDDGTPQLSIVLKGDVDGSVEAIMDVLDTYQSDQCRLDLLNYGVGAVTQHDLEMAESFNGIIFSFNTAVPPQIAKIAKSKNIAIRQHNIIYRLFEEIKLELTKKLPLCKEKIIIGEAEVLQTFFVDEGKKKNLPVAGCHCRSGLLNKKKLFQLVRNGESIYDGTISSLKHFKNEVETIKRDTDCGLRLADESVAPQPGDTLICYELQERVQEIDWDVQF